MHGAHHFLLALTIVLRVAGVTGIFPYSAKQAFE